MFERMFDTSRTMGPVDFQTSLFADDTADSAVLSPERRQLSHGAWVDVQRNWLCDPDTVFSALVEDVPWRAERRKLRQKEFGVMLGASALGAALLAFLIVGYHKAQIEGQNERNAYVQDQITQVDAKIKEIEELDKKKARLLARKQVIEPRILDQSGRRPSRRRGPLELP